MTGTSDNSDHSSNYDRTHHCGQCSQLSLCCARSLLPLFFRSSHRSPQWHDGCAHGLQLSGRLLALLLRQSST